MEPQILAAMSSGINFTSDENRTIQQFLELEKRVDPKNPFSNPDDREYNRLRPTIEKLLQTKYACLAPDEYYPEFYKQGANGEEFNQVAVLGASYIMDPTFSYRQPCYQAEWSRGRRGDSPSVPKPAPVPLEHPAPPSFPETESPFEKVQVAQPAPVRTPGLLGKLLIKVTDDKENGRPFDEAYFEANAPGRSKYYRNIYDQTRTAPTSANPFLAPPPPPVLAPAPTPAPTPAPATTPAPASLAFTDRLAQAKAQLAAVAPGQTLREKASNLAATARSGLSELLAPPPPGSKLTKKKGGKTRRRKLKSSRRA
jgi:hypothetical protein